MLIGLSKIKKCASDVVFIQLWIISNLYLLIFTKKIIAVKFVMFMQSKLTVLLIDLNSMHKTI